MPRYELTIERPRGALYPHHPQTIGEHIRKRRMDLHLPQDEAGKLLGVTGTCIYLWEADENIPQISYFPRITQFLGYSLWQFDTTTLSGRVLDYRHRNGLSAMRFGELVGVDSSTVRSWELGATIRLNEILKKLNALLENNKPLE